MAFQAGAITAVLGLDAAAFMNPMTGALEILTRFGAMVTDVTGRLMSMAEGVTLLGSKTGVSVETIQTLRAVFDDAGVGASTADDAISQLNRRLGDAVKDGGATAKTLQQLGIDIENVGRGDAAFRKILDQLAAIKDDSVRAAAGAEIFGKSAGDQIVTALGGGSKALDEAQAKYKAINKVVGTETVAEFAALDDVMDTLGNTFEGLQNTIVIELFKALGINASNAEGSLAVFSKTVQEDVIPYISQLADGIGILVGWLEKLLGPLAKVIGYFIEFQKFGVEMFEKVAQFFFQGDALSAEQLARPGFQALPAPARAGR